MATTLDIVNDMIGTIGQLPLNELDARHPYVPTALRVLFNVNREVQANMGRGWWFNRLTSFTLRADEEGFIAFPADLIIFRPFKYPDRYGVIGGKLHDNVNDTNVFTPGQEIKGSAVRCLNVEDTPVLAHGYITYEAVKKFTRNYDGDMAKIADLKQEANNSLLQLRTQEIREARANTQRNPQVRSVLVDNVGLNRYPTFFY